MAEFFAAIAERPQPSVFIHCWLGADQTGVLVAAYRIAFEHCTPEMAIEEMDEFHFNSFWHPTMKEYIQHFPRRLATAQALTPDRAMPKSAARAVPSPAPRTPAPPFSQYRGTALSMTPASFPLRPPSSMLFRGASPWAPTEENHPCKSADTKSSIHWAPEPTVASCGAMIR